jgi:hypothetical protein
MQNTANWTRSRLLDLGLALGLATLLLVTNRILSLGQMLSLVQTDVLVYKAIAASAPALPDGIAPHHLQRFAIPYVLGLVHQFLPIDLEVIFLIVVVLTIFLLAALTTDMLKPLRLPQHSRWVLVALALFQSSVFRHYIAVPFLIVDLCFLAGLTLSLQALQGPRPILLISGCGVMALTRQSAIAILPALLLWINLASSWKAVSARGRQVTSLAVTLIILGVYYLTSIIADRASSPSDVSHYPFGLWSYLRANPEHPVGELVVLAFRPFGVWLPLIGWVGGLRAAGQARERLPIETWLLVLACSCLWMQPVLAGPEITGGNNVRLTNLGWPSAVLFAGYYTASFRPLVELTMRQVLAISGLALLASQHHHWSRLGSVFLQFPAYLLLLQSAVGLGIGAIAFRAARRPQAVPFIMPPAQSRLQE